MWHHFSSGQPICVLGLHGTHLLLSQTFLSGFLQSSDDSHSTQIPFLPQIGVSDGQLQTPQAFNSPEGQQAPYLSEVCPLGQGQHLPLYQRCF